MSKLWQILKWLWPILLRLLPKSREQKIHAEIDKKYREMEKLREEFMELENKPYTNAGIASRRNWIITRRNRLRKQIDNLERRIAK